MTEAKPDMQAEAERLVDTVYGSLNRDGDLEQDARVECVAAIAAALEKAHERGRLEEREACARVCEGRAWESKRDFEILSEAHNNPDERGEPCADIDMLWGDHIGAEALAKAIRARGSDAR